jgi:hypothetical protein
MLHRQQLRCCGSCTASSRTVLRLGARTNRSRSLNCFAVQSQQRVRLPCSRFDQDQHAHSKKLQACANAAACTLQELQPSTEITQASKVSMTPYHSVITVFCTPACTARLPQSMLHQTRQCDASKVLRTTQLPCTPACSITLSNRTCYSAEDRTARNLRHAVR